MSAGIEPYQSPQLHPAQASFEDYRALSSAAMASLLIGLLSGVVFLSPWLAVLPLLGMVAGGCALIQIRRRPDELTGRGLAWIGLGLSLFSFLGGIAAAAIVYATEVPPGYTRISYVDLQPEDGVPGQFIPPLARKLDGQKVFIKGYVFPGAKPNGIKEFLLVRDKGDCCFGGNPKLTDRIQVTLKDPLRLTRNLRVNKVAGTFRIRPADGAVDAGGAVIYHLEADHLE